MFTPEIKHEPEDLIREVVITPGNPMFGELIVPGDKVSSVHLLLATLLADCRTDIKNAHFCGDVKRLTKWINSSGLADVNYSNNSLSVTPRPDDRPEMDLSELGDTRSNICLVTAQTLRHGRTVFKGTGGCNFAERKIDHHLRLMHAFGIDVEDTNDKWTAILKKKPDMVEFDCATKEYGPSVGVTCHALIAGLTYDKQIVLNNSALEPASDTLVQYIKSVTNREITTSGRTIIIKPAEKIAYSSIDIKLPPDLTVAFTYIACLIATGGKIYLKDVNNFPQILVDLLKKMNVDFETYDKGFEFFVDKRLITHPEDVTCEVWPGFPSDMGPLLSAAVAGKNGETEIIDFIYSSRASHVVGLNKMGYQLEANGNKVHIIGAEPKNLNEFRVEAPDIRAGAALVVGALGRRSKSIITNYYQVFRGYSSLVNDLKKTGIAINAIR